MKKTLLAVALTGGLGIAAPAVMAADKVQFLDSDTAGTFILLDKLNTIVTTGGGVYSVVVDTSVAGGAKTLDAGDTFVETIELTVSSSSLTGGGTSFDLGGDYRIEAVLHGVIGNVVGTGITINDDDAFGAGLDSVSGLGTTSFDVSFNPFPTSTLKLFNVDTGVQISEMELTSGGVSGVQLVAGQLLNTVTLNALLGTESEPFLTEGDTYIQNGEPGKVGDSLDNQVVKTVTTSSTRIATTDQANNIGKPAPVFGTFESNTLEVVFFDNGAATTFQIPEPAPLALMGLGLLGLAGLRRKKDA